jgi:carbonic anhydrase
MARAADHAPAAQESHAATAKKPAASADVAKSMGEQVHEAVDTFNEKKRITLVVNGKEKKFITVPAKAPAEPAEVPAETPAKAAERGHTTAPASNTVAVVIKAKPSRPRIHKAAQPKEHETILEHPAAPVAAIGAPHQGGELHWSYEGETGPQAWGKLKPEFNLCATGKRQSPINIDESTTLQGPAEPLQFNYTPSGGSVLNNGHTIQVDLYGDNSLTVRGSNYKLVQFHFHNPSEEQINYRSFAMVVHLVHKNAEGQLAVVSVLLDAGEASDLINKVWTYMPLESGDRVRMPLGLIDLNELLPKDQRYYQFMGSLTTPPCSEGVLWMVLKQTSTASREQIKLFSQLFPQNARPVQPANGRAIRNAQ